MLPEGLTDCLRCGQPTRGMGGALCADCEPRRCRKCARFIARDHEFDLCADCLDNAQPDSNEGGYTRIANQFDAERRAA